MSWSKSVTGRGSELFAATAAWPEEIKATDEGWNAPDGTKQGHAAQVDAARRVLEVIGNVWPDHNIAASAFGHADSAGAGNVGVNYSFPPASNDPQ